MAGTVTMNRRYKPSTAHRLYYHFVFRTKNWRRILVDEAAAAVRQAMYDVCVERSYRLIHCKVQPHHVHILIKLRPSDYLPTVAQMLKGRSAHDVLKEYPHLGDVYAPTGERNLWAKGYWVSTAGLVKVPRIRAYIRGQRKHHAPQPATPPISR